MSELAAEEYMSPEEYEAKIRADILGILDDHGMVPLSAMELVVREWCAISNEGMRRNFKEWNEALARGEQQSMSITHDAGGVWEWMRHRLEEVRRGIA